MGPNNDAQVRKQHTGLHIKLPHVKTMKIVQFLKTQHHNTDLTPCIHLTSLYTLAHKPGT